MIELINVRILIQKVVRLGGLWNSDVTIAHVPWREIRICVGGGALGGAAWRLSAEGSIDGASDSRAMPVITTTDDLYPQYIRALRLAYRSN